MECSECKGTDQLYSLLADDLLLCFLMTSCDSLKVNIQQAFVAICQKLSLTCQIFTTLNCFKNSAILKHENVLLQKLI